MSFSIAEAKSGKGKGKGAKGFKARGGADVVLGSPVDARGRTAFSSTFPRGNAWGLRGRRGESVPARTRRDSDLRDGDTIFRGGRDWIFDADTDLWVPR